MVKFFKINVSTVIFNSENKVLIQKRSEDEDIFPGLWGIPGGTTEMTDKSIFDALKREVKEEVDVEIDNINLFKENIVVKELYGVSYMVFISKYVAGEPKPLDGTAEVFWLEEGDLENYEFTPTIKETLNQAFIWKKSQQ